MAGQVANGVTRYALNRDSWRRGTNHGTGSPPSRLRFQRHPNSAVSGVGAVANDMPLGARRDEPEVVVRSWGSVLTERHFGLRPGGGNAVPWIVPVRRWESDESGNSMAGPGVVATLLSTGLESGC